MRNSVGSARSLCHHRGISTVLLQPLNVHPVSQKEYPQSEWSMTIQTLRFKLVHVSALEWLNVCLRFKLVQVAENVQRRTLGSHFSVGRRILCNTRSLSLLDHDLASKIDYSSLGAPMLTLNFINSILQFWVKFRGKNNDYVYTLLLVLSSNLNI